MEEKHIYCTKLEKYDCIKTSHAKKIPVEGVKHYDVKNLAALFQFHLQQPSNINLLI